ncbi:dTMP kinase [Candidatus Profftella armatura (Diaphorina cf. continua)]|uniref:Thymidylate kinase n=1 Tax=Candidatus Profftella armatura (Diaphorina cf. continua) TaxID=2661583 RepID=A0A7R6VYY3_9PROT|nr:dTMP kinase [Candidatus Profftella armatura (Diaphorina cf. continua)]BCG49732.1 dTMP kinase [Candidatus Profftella armatura (Diaphorina cf. continua)]
MKIKYNYQFFSKFITFEGIDGSGKSTHIKYIIKLLKTFNINVIFTREPGGTPLGEILRNLLLHKPMHPETETLLMFAARREHIAKVIKPALKKGICVISDRFTDSSFAYQGGGRKILRNKIKILEKWVHPDIKPDLTLLFDLPLEIAKKRLSITKSLDKFEVKKNDFFNSVRTEYLRLAKKFPIRFRIINSNESIIKIENQLKKFLLSFLHKNNI